MHNRRRQRYISRMIRNQKKLHTKLKIIAQKMPIVPVRKCNIKKLRKLVY
jgi:hypothetical protein